MQTLGEVLDMVDYVLVMSVNPGFGGQRFIPGALEKVRKLATMRAAKGVDFRIEIDGGIDLQTVGPAVRAGAEILVAGSHVFGHGNPAENAEALLRAAQEATLLRGVIVNRIPEVVMMFRRVIIAVLLGTMLFAAGCTNKKVKNPIANVDSKQPDKVLYDRAMDAMKHSKYDVARLSLQTLINTYPDSEYVARAKLAIGDSWYAEGGSAAWTQAESEYKDFQTFFPNMPEAAEAQMKIANIHYKEMEKPDRDYTHAKRAEDEYRQLILQYPDSKLVPEAKQRLLEVQEVLAEREYLIGHFYFVREVLAGGHRPPQVSG